MLVNPKELTNDKEFWKVEQEIGQTAVSYVKTLKDHTVYDFHEINPTNYNMRPDKEQKDNKKQKKDVKNKEKVKEKKVEEKKVEIVDGVKKELNEAEMML